MPVTRYNSLKTNAGAYVSGDTIFQGPVRMRGVLGYNSGPAQFILFFDSNVVPADGVVPDYFMPVGAGQGFSLVFPEMTDFDFGLSWCCSSTVLAKTVGSANIAMVVSYGGKINQ